MVVTIYHNPRCSKSRATLALIRERGVEPEIIEYLQTPPDAARLRFLLRALGKRPADLIRRGEQAWKNLRLSADADDAALITAMIANPLIIERPIVVRGDQAVLGRPPENVLDLLDGKY